MDIHASIDQIMEAPQLIGTQFYEIFFDRFPEAKEFFDGVDMERQSHVLTMSLMVVQQLHSKRYEATTQYLRYLGTQHHDRNIPKELYPKWREAMLATLQNAHGEAWNEALEQSWAEAFDHAIALMLDGYDNRVTI